MAELKRAGLWSEKRLPRVLEPSRPKTHWDYVLEEMAWMATDFAQERKWKKNAAKKHARLIQKQSQDIEQLAEKRKKEEEMKLKKIASLCAKEVRQFWGKVEKVSPSSSQNISKDFQLFFYRVSSWNSKHTRLSTLNDVELWTSTSTSLFSKRRSFLRCLLKD